MCKTFVVSRQATIVVSRRATISATPQGRPAAKGGGAKQKSGLSALRPYRLKRSEGTLLSDSWYRFGFA
jgi:hypothetical protein